MISRIFLQNIEKSIQIICGSGVWVRSADNTALKKAGVVRSAQPHKNLVWSSFLKICPHFFICLSTLLQKCLQFFVCVSTLFQKCLQFFVCVSTLFQKSLHFFVHVSTVLWLGNPKGEKKAGRRHAAIL